MPSQPSSWRVGMIVPLEGSAGIFGPSCQAVAELAAAEFNEENGVLGRQVELEFIDAGQPPREVAARVAALAATGRLDAVTGWHISSVRHALVPAIAGRLPYVYTSLYEGGERRPGVYCSGEVPNFQIVPALAWMARHLGKRRWFVVGHDYVWPRQTAVVLTEACAELGIEIVGEAFVRMDAGRVDLLVEEVARTACDGVLMLLVGQEAALFNRLFAEQGLSDRMVRYSPLMEENMVMASGPEATEDLYVSAGFFRTLVTAGSFDLQSRYAAFHGAGAPPLNNVAESCYEGMHTLAHLTRLAGSSCVQDMNRLIGELGYDGPRGTVQFHGNQATHPVHLARAEGLDFEIIDQL
jgi:ABC-type branched-subunit amino acid transport system substrate-binding protein